MYHQHRRPKVSKRALAATIVLGGLLTGCVSEQAPSASHAPLPRLNPAPTAADTCSDNLHDLSGYLLQYYGINHRLPATLDQLAPLADADRPLSLNCPVSHQPYIYVPDMLEIPGEANQLVLYDPEPSHSGHRLALVTRRPQGSTPLGLWVIELDETTLRKYHAAQPPASAPH